MRVAVTGAGGAIGRRAVAQLRAGGDDVLLIDPLAPDLKRALEGTDVLVHLAFAVGEDVTAAARNIDGTERVLAAGGDAGVAHVVLLSSAAVYGAWPNNPVPLTEDAPVRPNPGFGFAAQKAELERLAGEWSDDHPGVTLTILRPAIPMDREQEGFLSDVLRVRAPVATGSSDVPVQFVHLDDLASAIAHASRSKLDGVYNVAADGWVTHAEARALAGTPPRVPVPARLRAVLARFGRAPAAVEPYTLHPWVVATDRLKATGWSPAHTNEVTVVETTEGMPWTNLTPKRKQELLLAGSVTGVVAAGAGVALFVRWLRRRRRRSS